MGILIELFLIFAKIGLFTFGGGYAMIPMMVALIGSAVFQLNVINHCKKGDVLARLDNEMAESSLRDMLYKAMENLTAIRRLRAAVQDAPSGSAPELIWPDDLRAWLETGTGYRLSEEQLAQGRAVLQRRCRQQRVPFLQLPEFAFQHLYKHRNGNGAFLLRGKGKGVNVFGIPRHKRAPHGALR